ncbi:AI-2E family transporter [Spirillospora sp. CA-255316]
MSDEPPGKDRPAAPDDAGAEPRPPVPAPSPPADDRTEDEGQDERTDQTAQAEQAQPDQAAQTVKAVPSEQAVPSGGSVRLGDMPPADDIPGPPRKDVDRDVDQGADEDEGGGERPEPDDDRPLPVVAGKGKIAQGSVTEDTVVGTAPDPAHDIEQRKREAGVDHRFPFGRPGQPLGNAHPFVFGFTGALGVITAWLLVRAAANAQSVIVTIVVAMFLAVGLNPAVERLKRIGLSRGWAVAVVFLMVVLFFAGFVASLVPPLTEQITALTRDVPGFIQQLQENEKIAEWDRRYRLLEQVQAKINDSDFQQTLAERALEVGRQALSGTVQSLTILILSLYFLGSLPQIKTFFYQLAPRSRRARVALLGDEILDRIGGYVAGQFTIAFIAGVTSYIFLEILGVPYALALALIVAVTDLIPLIGATIGAVIVTLVAFLTGLPEGIICLIFYVIYQQVENYLVYPRVMKRTVNVQPAVTVVAALIGAALLGVIGALLAIPTAAAISLVIREVWMPRQESI